MLPERADMVQTPRAANAGGSEDRSEATPDRLASILAPVSAALARVETRLQRFSQYEETIIGECARHILFGPAKRLRPALVLLSASARPPLARPAIDIAAALELIHTGTLVHDDLVDGSVLRRKRETINARWGDRLALLSGEYLYARATAIVSQHAEIAARQDHYMVRLLADTASKMYRGEVLQYLKGEQGTPSEKDYRRIIQGKTASLISACCQVGALVQDAPLEVVKGLGRYGTKLGLAFQIVDDLLDFVADESRLGKATFSDFARGRSTLPLIRFQAMASPAQRRRMDEALALITEPSARREALNLLGAAGALEACRAEARRHGEDALRFLDCVEPSPARQSLADLVRYTMDRTR